MLIAHRLKTQIFAAVCSLVILNTGVASTPQTPKSLLQPSFSGAYAMPDEYSAKVVSDILRQGGNAFDAAVAGAFTLAVTFPEAGNLGGGGFMTLAVAEKGKVKDVRFLDYRETAPEKAFRDLYLDEKGDVIPFASLIGAKASGVPGTVMGMWQAHQAYGRLSWEVLLQPAIELAKNGFTVSRSLQNTREWYQKWVSQKPDEVINFDVYFAGLQAGENFKQPELAKTLQRIAKKGVEEFYQGETADLLVNHYKKIGGLISKEDLQNYTAKWRQPIAIEWQGKKVISAPPPSSGGIAIAQLLKMQSVLWPKFQEKLNALQSEAEREALRVHFYAEMMKRVYADRAQYLGDSDFVSVPIETLISDKYLHNRAGEVNLTQISSTEKVKPGMIESPETTHFSIVDAYGNAVSNTYTLNMPFGNGVVIEGAGFLMNNEMDDFSTKPGVANIFGVLGGAANEVAPNKRMLSSMSPTIVMNGDKVETVVGTPGGSTIITSVFQSLMNLYVFGMNAQEAVDAPRVHHQLFPKNRINYNPEISAEVADELTLMGYEVKKHNYMGDVQLLCKPENEHWEAASDMRGRGVSGVLLKARP